MKNHKSSYSTLLLFVGLTLVTTILISATDNRASASDDATLVVDMINSIGSECLCCPDGPQHTYEDGVPGQLPDPNTVQAGWQEEYGIADYYDDGCEDSAVSISLAGASFGFQGSAVEYSVSGFGGQQLQFEQGKTYCISYCYRLGDDGVLNNPGSIKFRAVNDAQNNSNCQGSCNEMHISPTVTEVDGWQQNQFTWTAPADYFALIISAANTASLDRPAPMLVDNVCITEDAPRCEASFSHVITACGDLHLMSTSCGDSLTYNWNINGDIFTTQDVVYTGVGTLTIILTITGADGCQDEVTQTIIATGINNPPVITCPNDTVITATLDMGRCVANYVPPSSTVTSGATVTCLYNGNPIPPGGSVNLTQGTHTFFCVVVDSCENVVECGWTVTVTCDSRDTTCMTFDNEMSGAIQDNFTKNIVTLLGNWQTRCSDLQYSNNQSQNGPSDNYLRAYDRGCGAPNGSSWTFNSVDFQGDWSDEDGCLCFDYRMFDDGGAQGAAIPINIYSGSTDPFTANLRAGFQLDNPLTILDGWTTICPPLGLSNNGQLPSNNQGKWVMAPPTGTAADWDLLISNVSGIAFPQDLTGSPTEIYGYDNICFDQCKTPPEDIACCCPDGPQHTFEGEVPGTLPGVGGTQVGWQLEYGFADYFEDGCSSSVSLMLPGASRGSVGSAAEFSISGFAGPELQFKEDQKYCISYCYKVGPGGVNSDMGNITLRATNSAQTTNACTGSCAVIDVSPTIHINDGWVTYQVIWTADADYEQFIVSANNISPVDAPSPMLIDNICITEYDKSCKASFSYTSSDCGDLQLTNESCGDSLTYNWNVNGTPYTTEDVIATGATTYNVTLTVTGADGCTDTVTETITTNASLSPSISCPKDTTIFGPPSPIDCLVPYSFPIIAHTGNTIICTIDGNPVNPGDVINLSPGSHIVQCQAINECDTTFCRYIITALCLPQGELCGRTVISCYSTRGFGVSDPNGFVLGIVNNKNWGPPLPTGTNWNAASSTIFHHPSWTASNMGEIFGLAIDAQDNIYATATSMFGISLSGPAGPGGIYKTTASGAVAPFVSTGPYVQGGNNLPNDGAGLGNICYDSINDQLFVTNFFDGRIYQIDMFGIVLDRIEPFPGGTPSSNIPTFSPLRHRPWGIAYRPQDNRLYFSNWNSYRSGTGPTTIHSMALPGGDFDHGSSPQLEITLDRYNLHTPISDIAVSNDGKLLLSGKSMQKDYPDAGDRIPNWAHRANIYEYELTASWNLTSGHVSTPKYNVGSSSRHDAAGGIDYGYESVTDNVAPILCDQSIWASGDYLQKGLNLGTGVLIYGLQGFTPAGGFNANSVLIDYDNSLQTSQKSGFGDVEIFKCGCYDPIVSCDSLMVMGERAVVSCIDSTQIDPNIICTAEFDPVCGCDGMTYGNACEAMRAGITNYSPGECTGSNTPIVEDLCCYTYDIKNNWGTDIIKLEVNLPNTDWQFSNVSLAAPFTFGTTNSNNLFDVINSAAPNIPIGVSTSAITMCFAPAVLNPTGSQEVEFRWLRQSSISDVPITECRDTLPFDCMPIDIDSCFTIVDDTLKCADPMNPYEYEYCFKVVNQSGFDISKVVLEDLLPGYSFLPSYTQTKIYTFPTPLPDQTTSTEICIGVASANPITQQDTFCLKMGLVNVEGDECCHEEDLICTEILPCCDPCEDSDLVFRQLDAGPTECCYSVDLINECYYNYFTKVEAEVLTSGVCFGSHSIGTAHTADWNVTSTPQKICLEPITGHINTGNYSDLLTFCLDKLDDPSKDNPVVVFRWYYEDPATGENLVACTDTLVTECEIPRNNDCVIVTDQNLVCLLDSMKYRYTFTIQNVSNLPFTAQKLHLEVKNAPNDYQPFPTGPVITLTPPLSPDSSRTISTCIVGAPFPATLGDFQFSYRLEGVNSGDCCWESVCDTIPIPPCRPIDPCDSLSITLEPDDQNIEQCCYIGAIDNQYSDTLVKGVKIVVQSPASITQVQTRNGWTINQLSPSEAELVPASGLVPQGIAEIFEICNANDGSPLNVSISWLISDADGNCIESCPTSFERSCPSNPGGCIAIVQDSIDCNNNMYCFRVQNNTAPEIIIKSVEFIQIGPSGSTLTPNPYSINPLSTGDTSEWICVNYNIATGSDLCFLLIGHEADLPAGEPISWCCADTARFCLTLDDCSGPCDSIDVVATPIPSSDGCCHEITLINNYSQSYFEGVVVSVDAPATLTNLTAAWGWAFQSFTLQTAVLVPLSGYIPLGTSVVAELCTDNYNTTPHILSVDWMINNKGACDIICEKDVELHCDIDRRDCIAIVEDSIDCNLEQYCFRVKNLNYYEDVNYLELINVLPDASHLDSTHVQIPTLGYGDTSDWICIGYNNLVSGDQICYNLTSHFKDEDGQLLTCCVNPLEYCIMIPDCPAPESCCTTSQEDIDDRLADAFDMSIYFCDVCIPFDVDSCEVFTVSFEDGVTQQYFEGDTICHRYTTSGTKAITIKLEILDGDGMICASRDTTYEIEVDCGSNICGEDISVGNVLSPDNGDLINQHLVVSGLTSGCGSVSLIVYNRAGQEVWSDYNYDNNWSGVGFRNEALPSGTYFIAVTFPDIEDGPMIRTFLEINRE